MYQGAAAKDEKEIGGVDEKIELNGTVAQRALSDDPGMITEKQH
jgi:hypothetical protein